MTRVLWRQSKSRGRLAEPAVVPFPQVTSSWYRMLPFEVNAKRFSDTAGRVT